MTSMKKKYLRLSEEERADLGNALEFVFSSEYIPELLPKEVAENPIFWDMWLEKNKKCPDQASWALPPAALSNADFMFKAISVFGMMLVQCSESLKEDPNFLLKLAEVRALDKVRIPLLLHFKKNAIAGLEGHSELCYLLVKSHPENYKNLPESQKADPKIILEALKSEALARHIPKSQLEDKVLMEQVLRANAKVFEFLPKVCRDESVLQEIALEQDVENYRYLYAPARNDPQIIRKVLEKKGELFDALSQKDRNNKEYFFLALESIQKNHIPGGLPGYRIHSVFRRLYGALNKKSQGYLNDLCQEMFQKDIFLDPLLLPKVVARYKEQYMAGVEKKELSEMLEKKEASGVRLRL